MCHRWPDLELKWVRLATNGTNLWIFLIKFSTFSTNPWIFLIRFSTFSLTEPIWPTLGPNLVLWMFPRCVIVMMYNYKNFIESFIWYYLLISIYLVWYRVTDVFLSSSAHRCSPRLMIICSAATKWWVRLDLYSCGNIPLSTIVYLLSCLASLSREMILCVPVSTK